jgi:tyrosine-protein phosphatase SIW14
VDVCSDGTHLMFPTTWRRFGPVSVALAMLGVPLFAGSVPGIRNFYQVDEHVYRGGQPTDAGFAYLAKLGVRTVLDLREDSIRARAEEKAVTAVGMRYVNVPMSGLVPPTAAQTRQVLSVLKDPAAGPVFVHCLHGVDRTGAVIAVYHIDHDQWENARAIQDANSHGMSWMQFPRRSYILHFQPQAVDVSAAAAGNRQ